MLMTAEIAKQMWCPFDKEVSNPYCMGPFDPSKTFPLKGCAMWCDVNKYDRVNLPDGATPPDGEDWELDPDSDVIAPAFHNAWRRVIEYRGYCGLAGLPAVE